MLTIVLIYITNRYVSLYMLSDVPVIPSGVAWYQICMLQQLLNNVGLLNLHNYKDTSTRIALLNGHLTTHLVCEGNLQVYHRFHYFCRR